MNPAAVNRFLGQANQILHDAVDQLLHFASKTASSIKNKAEKALAELPAGSQSELPESSDAGPREPNHSHDRHYFELFDGAPDAFITSDTVGSIVEANNAAGEIFSIPKELLIGKSLGAFVSESHRSIFEKFMEDLAQSPRILGLQIDLILPNGSTFLASISAARGKTTERARPTCSWIIRHVSEAIVANATTDRNQAEQDAKIQQQNKALAKANAEMRAEMIEREKAEQRIREQNEFLNHVIESLPHPFYVLDAKDFTIKMANSAAGEMTETTTCYALTHRRTLPCDGLEHRCPLQEVKITKKPVIVEHIHFDKDGNPKNVEVHGYPIFDEHNEVVQMIEYSLDITERKRLEEELQNNAEKIKLFAYTISHDLKSPIIGVHGLVELLSKKYGDILDDTGKKYCEQILKASRQVVALVEELNIFIRSKETRLNIELTNVQEVLETIRNEFSPLLDLRKIRWFEPDHLPTLKADKLSLLRVFRNLVENALKYGGENLSEIRIGYESSNSEHVFTVRDNGVGVNLKDCESIFELFHRNQTSRGIEGSGLGLAIVKELAIKHGGNVWAKPNEFGGAAFYFSISKDL